MMTMEKEDVQILVRMLRAFRGWTQTKLAAEAGMDRSSIRRYENGKQKPTDATLQHLIAVAGLSLDVAESFLPAVIRLVRHLSGPAPGGEHAARFNLLGIEPGLHEDGAVEDLRIAWRAALSFLAGALAAYEGSGRLAGGPPLAGAGGGLRTLAERLCEASVRAAADKAADALELARMAVRAAERAEGGEAWKKRLQGWARAFLANALRVCGQLRLAEAALREAWRLWHAGRDGDPDGRLPEWRLLDLEASLRREQLRVDLALALLQRARRAAPPEEAGRLLVSTASALEQAGDFSGAVEALREAELRFGEGAEPRERWCLAFNLVVNLCKLGRFEEARQGLPEVRQLAGKLGNELDSLRVGWLGARVNLGLGRDDEARAGFEQARDQFERSRNAVGSAVVSLELAAMDLAAGRTAEVKALAEKMAWILATEGIEREALEALRLFCEAAMQEKATLAQAQQVLARLERPGLLRLPGRR